MFGFVTASVSELDKAQKDRYGGIYCGICREIKARATQTARLGLSYDMAFLALLLMSLYEPEEEHGALYCAAHPLRRRDWIDNEYVRYDFYDRVKEYNHFYAAYQEAIENPWTSWLYDETVLTECAPIDFTLHTGTYG